MRGYEDNLRAFIIALNIVLLRFAIIFENAIWILQKILNKMNASENFCSHKCFVYQILNCK